MQYWLQYSWRDKTNRFSRRMSEDKRFEAISDSDAEEKAREIMKEAESFYKI